MTTTLRQALRADIPAMHRVRTAVRENRLTSSVVTEADYVAAIEESGRGWVVDVDGEIAGFAVGNATDGSIWALFVDSRHEGRGYGRSLHDCTPQKRNRRVLTLTTAQGDRAHTISSRPVLRTVFALVSDFWFLVRSMCRSRTQLAAENLFLRKQLAYYVERQVRPRRADNASRITLVLLSRLVEWRDLLTIVRPDTLVRWHGELFRLFWRAKSRRRGRPRIPHDLQRRIAEMAAANRTWGEERIAAELRLKLGLTVSPRTVRPLLATAFPAARWPVDPVVGRRSSTTMPVRYSRAISSWW